jgi:hypothetical protein
MVRTLPKSAKAKELRNEQRAAMTIETEGTLEP